MKRNLLLLSLLSSMLLIWACTPKTTDDTADKNPPPAETPKPPTNSKCPTFKDAPNEDQITTDYVLCRDLIKAEKYDEAFPLWEKVYAVSPAADGKRSTVYNWGITLYTDKYNNAEDANIKKMYVDKIMKLYDEIQECYPDKASNTYGFKGFDIYYTFPEYFNKKEQYTAFKKSLDAGGDKTQSFVLLPLADLLVSMYNDKEIDQAEAQKYDSTIRRLYETRLKKAAGDELAELQGDYEYASEYLSNFETIRGFYDCAYYKKKYLAAFQEDKKDCDVINDTYSILKWGNCPETDVALKEVDAAWVAECKPKTTVTGPDPKPETGPSCNDFSRNGEYDRAIECWKEKYNSSSDNSRKAKYAYAIAALYYGKKRNFGTAREWANKASGHDSNWGKPYLLIGDMYASSGRLCGPGRGWKSQIVIWPAMDMWAKAKRDPQTADKAQRQINKYSQYLPEKSDCFMNGVENGDPYTVKCWIQRKTTCRCK